MKNQVAAQDVIWKKIEADRMALQDLEDAHAAVKARRTKANRRAYNIALENHSIRFPTWCNDDESGDAFHQAEMSLVLARCTH